MTFYLTVQNEPNLKVNFFHNKITHPVYGQIIEMNLNYSSSNWFTLITSHFQESPPVEDLSDVSIHAH